MPEPLCLRCLGTRRAIRLFELLAQEHTVLAQKGRHKLMIINLHGKIFPETCPRSHKAPEGGTWWVVGWSWGGGCPLVFTALSLSYLTHFPRQTCEQIMNPSICRRLPQPLREGLGWSVDRCGWQCTFSPEMLSTLMSTPVSFHSSLHFFPVALLTQGFSESFISQFLLFWHRPCLKYIWAQFHMGLNRCLRLYCVTRLSVTFGPTLQWDK